MAKGKDFVPKKIDTFNTWQKNLAQKITDEPNKFGMGAQDVTDINNGRQGFELALAAEVAQRDAYHAAVGYLHTKWAEYDAVIRSKARIMQANPGVTAEAKREIDITVPDHQHTPVPPPADIPVGVCEAGARFAHSLDFRAAGARTRGLPKGSKSCEVWRKKGGAPPVDETECELAGNPSKSPYKMRYPGADAGKTIHYLLRFVSTRGAPGDWSETVSAMVQG